MRGATAILLGASPALTSAKFEPDPGDYVDAALDWALDAVKLFPKKKRYIVNFLAATIRTTTS